MWRDGEPNWHLPEETYLYRYLTAMETLDLRCCLVESRRCRTHEQIAEHGWLGMR